MLPCYFALYCKASLALNCSLNINNTCALYLPAVNHFGQECMWKPNIQRPVCILKSIKWSKQFSLSEKRYAPYCAFFLLCSASTKWIFMSENTFEHVAMIDRHVNPLHLPSQNKWTQRVCVVWDNTIFVQCMFQSDISSPVMKKGKSALQCFWYGSFVRKMCDPKNVAQNIFK